MDNSKSQIPINTRTIGNPEEIHEVNNLYTLYIEDYVHTFLQKNLEKDKNAIKISLFGNCIKDKGVLKFVISGAALSDKKAVSYFPSCEYLGMASVTKSGENNLRLELMMGGVIVIIEDYYIYYSQNEEMQNYLVAWNTHKSDLCNMGTMGKARQARSLDAARYGRILQAYNKEEAKISFIWRTMNILCLSFTVCFMAYGIITINNYSKMKSIQSGIDYCMKMLDMQMLDNQLLDDQMLDDQYVYSDTSTEIYSEETKELQSNQTDEDTAEETINNTIPQYYIVQKGDTLRNICYEIYGDYDYVEKVCLWNNIDDPNNILCGQKLLLQGK
jgi:hypothetical protein